MSFADYEIATRNLNAFKDLILTEFEKSTLMEQIPDGSHLIVLPHNSPDLLVANLKIAADIIHRMAVGTEPQAPVVLLTTTKKGEFILTPIYDLLNPVG